MNVGFFIDKSQTVQSILGLIREVKKRGYHCDVFSTCSRKSLRNIPKIGIDLNDVGWLTFENRDRVGREVIKNHDKYHALIGINLFNNILIGCDFITLIPIVFLYVKILGRLIGSS